MVAELSDTSSRAHSLSLGATFAETRRTYRLLFTRFIVTAGSVYAVLTAGDILHHVISAWPAELLALALFVGWIAGPAIVCGACIELVGNVHDGRAPRPVTAVLRLGRDRVLPLIGALLFYWVGTAVGLVFLIVPGLMIAARWSLQLPIVILEEIGLGEARDRSTKLVQEQTGTVLVIVLIPVVLCGLVWALPQFVLDGFWLQTLVRLVGYTLTAPLYVTVLCVVYYSVQSGNSSARS